MTRTRRLKEIADANNSAFAATPGTEWWLAEAPAAHDLPSPAPQAKSPEPAEHKQDMALTVAVPVPEVTPVAPEPVTGFNWLQVVRPDQEKASSEKLGWDQQNHCFAGGV